MPPAPPEAEVIKLARTAARLSPDEAAAKVREAGGRISASYWRDVERGHGGRRGLRVTTRASEGLLAQMAQAVGVDAEQLAAAGRADAATVLAEMSRRGPAVPADADLPPVLRGLDPREVEPFLQGVDADLAAALTGERQPFDEFETGILRNGQHSIDAKRVLIAIARMYRAGVLPGQSRNHTRSGLTLLRAARHGNEVVSVR
jgi:hypothetical protein